MKFPIFLILILTTSTLISCELPSDCNYFNASSQYQETNFQAKFHSYLQKKIFFPQEFIARNLVKAINITITCENRIEITGAPNPEYHHYLYTVCAKYLSLNEPDLNILNILIEYSINVDEKEIINIYFINT